MRQNFSRLIYIVAAAAIGLSAQSVYSQDDEGFEEEDFAESEVSEEDFGAEFDESEQTAEVGDELEPLEPVEAEPPPLLSEEPAVDPETAPVPETTLEEPAMVEAEDPLPESEPIPESEPLQIGTTPPVADEPNLNYEAKLHDIFMNFYNSKTPQAEWDALVGSRQAERYQIQSGDNLWGVSQTIFGDGHYWPKVWSLNSNIKNPHLISPNNSIRFILGDESEPPSFTVTENVSEETNVEVSKSQTVEQTINQTQTTEVTPLAPTGESFDEEPEIPPPLKTSRPVVKKLPPSLPIWQDVASQGNYDELGIDYARRKILDIEDSIPLPSYIAEDPPNQLGQVSEVEVGHQIASAYQYIYVSMEPGYGEVGETYLVVANRGRVQSVHPTISGFLGYSIDVQGEVQLVERVSANSGPGRGDMFRALVLRIINPVGVGSVLTSGRIERVAVTEQGPRSQVVAQIIGGSFFNRRQVHGNESIAYLNRGEEDGLQVGQVLPIRANRKVRNINTEIESNIRPIGWLRIVKTTPSFSTAVIVRAWSDVLSGDLTGAGEMLPAMGSARNVIDEAQAGPLSDELDVDEPEDSEGEGFDESSDFNDDSNFGDDSTFE